MKKALVSTLLLAVVCFYGLPAVYGELQPVSGKTKGSIYSYSDNDIPEVFFFPKEKARWDGTKVTMSEWYMLTDLQKEKFVSEYLDELKKNYQGTLQALGLEYLNALDLFSYYANEKTKSEPSTRVIDLLVKGQERSGAL